MKFHKAVLGLLFVLFGFVAISGHSGTARTQSIPLRKGWNAVFIQVTPANLNPSAVFANTPVSMVAAYLAANTPIEFVQNPGAIPWKKEGWAVWYAPNRADAFLSNLATVNGNRAYLIHSTEDYVLNLQGDVTFQPPKWKSDSFNFIGFCLDEQSPPTFDKFFKGSSAHRPSRIYQLVNGEWTLVANPVNATMKSGEAYWIYCKGGSDFQGPLTAKLVSGQSLIFSSSGESHVLFVNRSGDPLGVRVERVSAELPLSYVMRGVSESRIEQVAFDLPANYSLPVMEPGATSGLWLKLRRAQMTTPSGSALLKISTDNGAVVWLPVTGTRDDLSATP